MKGKHDVTVCMSDCLVTTSFSCTIVVARLGLGVVHRLLLFQTMTSLLIHWGSKYNLYIWGKH